MADAGKWIACSATRSSARRRFLDRLATARPQHAGRIGGLASRRCASGPGFSAVKSETGAEDRASWLTGGNRNGAQAVATPPPDGCGDQVGTGDGRGDGLFPVRPMARSRPGWRGVPASGKMNP